jgi:hypothetical protein
VFGYTRPAEEYSGLNDAFAGGVQLHLRVTGCRKIKSSWRDLTNHIRAVVRVIYKRGASYQRPAWLLDTPNGGRGECGPMDLGGGFRIARVGTFAPDVPAGLTPIVLGNGLLRLSTT